MMVNKAPQASRHTGHATAHDPAIAPDCRHYLGDKPCLHNRLCAGCDHYDPITQRVCVIKLGALGDVVRTLGILPELRKRYPNAQITWVSKANGCRMIRQHPMIDRTAEMTALNAMALANEAFDLAICLDKEAQPCALMNSLKATQKLGMGLSECGTPVPLNREAFEYFHLGLSDDLKFHHNALSYLQLVYGALGWSWQGQRYELPVSKESSSTITALLEARGWQSTRPTLGINVGAGRVFANKMWPAPKTHRLARQLLLRHAQLQIVLLGGPDEAPVVAELKQRLSKSNESSVVIDPGTDHREPEFVALVDHCDALFTGDTMAMHVALARRKNVVAVFGPTCEQEIDLFGFGEKLVAPVACGPCYKRVCDQHDACLDGVTVEQAYQSIERVMGLSKTLRISLDVLSLRQAM